MRKEEKEKKRIVKIIVKQLEKYSMRKEEKIKNEYKRKEKRTDK